MRYIDIETASGQKRLSDLDIRGRTLWGDLCKRKYAKELIDSDKNALYKEKAALHSEFGRIVCITVGVETSKGYKDHSFYGENEMKLLADFAMVCGSRPIIFFGHNIKGFDIPYICQRMIILGIKIPSCLNVMGKKPWDIKHEDSMEMWKFGGWGTISLDRLTWSLGIESPKDDISGKDVSKCFWNGEIERIKTYCEKDVKVLPEVRRFLIQNV